MGRWVYGAIVLMGAWALFTMSGTQRERALLGGAALEPLFALEASVAAHPNDPEAVRTLAQAYLDARLPGLAVVLIDDLSAPVRADLHVEHIHARALLEQGRNGDALVAEGRVIASCRPPSEGAPVPAECDPVLLASAERRTGILQAMLALGVNDTRAHPEASLIAYQNATREAHVTVR